MHFDDCSILSLHSDNLQYRAHQVQHSFPVLIYLLGAKQLDDVIAATEHLQQRYFTDSGGWHAILVELQAESLVIGVPVGDTRANYT